MKFAKETPVQASRLIPRHVYADLGTKQPTAAKQPQIAQLIDLRLPGNLSNSIRLQPVAFNEQTYKVEASVNYKDEKGVLQTKQCAVSNFIRWRATKNDASGLANHEVSEREKLDSQLGLSPTKAPQKVSLFLVSR